MLFSHPHNPEVKTEVHYIYHRKVFAKIYTYHTYLLVTFFRFVNNNQV